VRVSSSSISPKKLRQQFSKSAVLENYIFTTVLLGNYKNQSDPGPLRQNFDSLMTQK